jgi:hypothetical protein
VCTVRCSSLVQQVACGSHMIPNAVYQRRGGLAGGTPAYARWMRQNQKGGQRGMGVDSICLPVTACAWPDAVAERSRTPGPHRQAPITSPGRLPSGLLLRPPGR